MKYDYELDRVYMEIHRLNAEHVLIQLPEGLKKDAILITKNISENAKCKITVSGSGSWGGCDLAIDEAKLVKADLLVHFGHARFVKTDFPVLYIEIKSKLDMVKILNKNLDKVNIGSIGLLSSVQYIHQLKDIKELLERNGKNVYIPGKKGFAMYDGHVVGCEYNGMKDIKNDVDGYLVIGNQFHSLGASLMVINKPVFLLSEHTEDIELMDDERDKIVKQRAQAIYKINQAFKIGILVDAKLGQYNYGIGKLIKKKLDAIGKECIIITSKEITPNSLMSFYDIEGFVNTACPRIGVDDYTKFEKPIINSREVGVITKDISWEKLLEQGLIGFF